MAIDLSTLDASTEVTFDVPVAFDDEGSPVAGFTVVGKNSDQYRAALRKQNVIAVKKSMQRGGKAPDAKTDAGAAQFLDDTTARDLAIAVACVVGWYGFTRAGVDIVCSAEEVAAVFEKRPTWLEKVTSAVGTDANFTQG